MDALKAYSSDSEESVEGSDPAVEVVNESPKEKEKDKIYVCGTRMKRLEQTREEKRNFFGINDEKSCETKKNVKNVHEESYETAGKSGDMKEEMHDSGNSTEDFLGIFSQESLRAQRSEKIMKHEEVVRKSVNVDNEKVTVEIPNSSFWKDIPVDDIEVDQETASGREEDVLHKMYKRDRKHLDKRCDYGGQPGDNHGHQRFLKRTKFSNELIHSVNKDTQQTVGCIESERRKIYFVHSKITPLLHNKRMTCRLPSSKEWDNPGHAGAVNRLKWNIPNYSHLLVTCSMDSSVKVWNIWSQLDPCVQVLRGHSKAVRDVTWNQDGRQLLSSSYDKSAIVSDVEKGVKLTRLEHSSYVLCCKYHTVNPHVCITGSNNQLQLWDTRTPSAPCKFLRYKDNIGQVQDLVLTADGSTLFSCSDLVSRDSADRNLMAWDFNTGIVLSNQIYQERFTLTRLQIHPDGNQLLAQSNGNYISLFSLQHPYKMNKHKRFEGHKLQGYNIGFDISPDGQTMYSGSADGKLYCYNFQSGRQLRSVNTGLPVVMDIACHPLLSSTVAVSSWDGTVQVWK